MTDDRDEVRARTDIVDLVGQRVNLKRVGKYYSGLCPFHSDKNPSFSVDPGTGRYRCWSCNESGDVFTWVMKTEQVDFPEALKMLAQRAGIELKSRDKEASQDRTSLTAAMMEARDFFRAQFVKSPKALSYCEQRGIDSSTQAAWELGYAPELGEALAVRLKKSGIPLPMCRDLYLVDQDSSGGYYDRFKGRLMFPIFDDRGNLVAFGGRLLGEGQPKYINSSDTPLYRKSKILYGLDKAKSSLNSTGRAVLVEGYLDVIACHRSGVTTAVASLGTSVTEDHAKLLKRWSREVVLLYDSDPAGQKATDRAIGILEAEKLRVRVAQTAEGDDPDTLFKREGAAALLSVVENSISPVAFKLVRLEKEFTPEQEEYWTQAIDILADAREDIEREGHLLKLAGQYPHTRDVRTALTRITKMVDDRKRPKPSIRREPRAQAGPEYHTIQEPMDSAELVVFGALQEPTFQKSAWLAILTPDLFATGAAIELGKCVANAFPSAPPEGPASTWISRVEPEAMRRLLSDISLDFRSSRITEELIMDSIGSLKSQSINRAFRRIRQGDLTPEERQELLQRIRTFKPDARTLSRKDEEDPFS